MLIAHIDKDTGKTQSLDDHLLNTAKKAAINGKKVGFEKTSILLALVHDIGKADPKFQNYIKNDTRDKVIHSNVGAKIIYDIIGDEYTSLKSMYKDGLDYFEDIVYYCVEAHHGIFNAFHLNDETIAVPSVYDKILYNEKHQGYDYNFVKSYSEKISEMAKNEFGYTMLDLIKLGLEEFSESTKKLGIDFSLVNIRDLDEEKQDEYNYYFGLYARLLLSILKSADVEDTINAYDNVINKNDFSNIGSFFFDRVEERYKSFGKSKQANELNQVRTDIADEVLKRGLSDSNGIYTLSLPTGAGKTLVSVRYAASQMKENGKERFFYITAFLSVLEQNAKEIREIFGDDELILEHHSNIVDGKKHDIYNENEDEEKKLVMDEFLKGSWESPCILTTMVQFFNTLFKGKSDNLRRFSSLINSIIVLDEVQSLPIKVTYPMNLTFNFLKNVMNSSLILCTATQPDYDNKNLEYKLEYGGVRGENRELYILNSRERSLFKRVKVKVLRAESGGVIGNTELLNHMNNQLMNGSRSILSISNTKRQTEDLYVSFLELNETHNLVKEENIYYLSTNMCPVHRQEVISEIKNKLKKSRETDEKVICFSTQLIEAGVDIDFDTCYRSYAGLDSLIQAIGRCNREGKLKYGQAYVYKTDQESLVYLKEISQKADVTDKILFDYEDKEVDLDSLNDQYFSRYFSEYKGDMRYLLKDDKTLLDILSSNPYINYQANLVGLTEPVLRQDFKDAAESFNLIDDDSQHSIIIEYDDYSREKILDLEEAYKDYQFAEARELIKELQPYTITVYGIDKYKNEIEEILDGQVYIFKGNYDDKLGIREMAEAFFI